VRVRTLVIAGLVALVALVVGGGAIAAAGAQSPGTLPERPAARDPPHASNSFADSLRAAGLPADPIYAKAAEGVFKGADDQRILAAARSLARELGEARGAIGSTAPPRRSSSPRRARCTSGYRQLRSGGSRRCANRRTTASSLATPSSSSPTGHAPRAA